MPDALARGDVAGGVKASCSGGSRLGVPIASAKGERACFYPAQHPARVWIQGKFTGTGAHLNFL